MKKIGSFLLVLTACLSFSACGKKKTTVKKTTTTSATTTQKKDDVKTYTFTSKSMQEAYGSLEGKFMLQAKIPYKVGKNYNTMDVTIALSGDNLFVQSDEGGKYFKDYDEGNYALYVYNTERNAYDSLSIVSKTEAPLDFDIEEALSITCGLTIKYTSKEENFDFISRKCTKYIYDYEKDGASITEAYVIDNITGICLKHSINSSATPAVETITEKTFEITNFISGTDVDTEFAAEESKIQVVPWDATFMASQGLANNGEYRFSLDGIKGKYASSLPTINLIYAESLYDNGLMYAHETEYQLYGSDNINYQFAMWIAENLYSCGAKYDILGTERDPEELCEIKYDTINTTKVTAIHLNAYTDTISQNYLEFEYSTESQYGTTISIRLVNESLDPDKSPKNYKSRSVEQVLESFDNKFSIAVDLPYYIPNTGYTTIEATLAAMDDKIYCTTPEGRWYYKQYDQNNDYCYVYDDDLDVYNIVDVFSKQVTKTYIDIEEELSIACGLDISYLTKEVNVSFLGRNCTKFVNVYDYINNTRVTETYIIDNLTGICLKHTIESNDTSSSRIMSGDTFEVTELVLGNDVEDIFIEQELLIAVTPWDSTFMGSHGFANVGTTHVFAFDDLYSSYRNPDLICNLEYAITEYNNNQPYSHEVKITLDGDCTIGQKGLFAYSVVSDLIYCGAKYNSEGDVVDWDNSSTDEACSKLITITEDINNDITSISLNGYTDSTKNNSFVFTYDYDSETGKYFIYIKLTDKANAPTI